MTVQQALKDVETSLTDISDAPDIDAQHLLLFAVSEASTTWLYTNPQVVLSEEQLRKLTEATQERMAGKPLAYILGEAEFFGRRFAVTPDVLIPRPETEDLVTKALTVAKRMGDSITIADIGTGTGCIAITLALEVPKTTHIIATDISPAALAVARNNAQHHNVHRRIEFLEGDMLTPLKNKSVDLIVSNPPYVPSDEVARAKESRDTIGLTFEPKNALDGGIDGQKYVEEIKKSGIPAIVETTGGKIELLSL